MSGREAASSVRRKRCNIDKQEKVVSLLWDYARQVRAPQTGCVITACKDNFQLSDGVIRKVLAEVMEIFGYGVLEVQ